MNEQIETISPARRYSKAPIRLEWRDGYPIQYRNGVRVLHRVSNKPEGGSNGRAPGFKVSEETKARIRASVKANYEMRKAERLAIEQEKFNTDSKRKTTTGEN